MKTAKNTFKAILALTCLFNGLAMAMQKPAKKQAWLEKAQEAQIASPLKIRLVNHTENTVKANKGQDKWTEVLGSFVVEQVSTMDTPAPYTIRSKNNVYVMNFEKTGNTFKALLEKVAIPASELENLDDNEVLNLAAIAHKTPAAQIDQIEPGNVLTIAIEDDAAYTTTNEREHLNLGTMGKGWFNVAMNGGISEEAQKNEQNKVSHPLKMRVVNHTGNQVKTVQQGRGNLWWAEIDADGILEDAYFNLVNLDENPSYKDTLLERHKGAPQYTISTDKNLYTVNFIKNGAYFKAILARIEGLANSSQLSLSTPVVLLTLAKMQPATPIQNIDQVKQGDVMTVTLDEEEAAELNLNE